MNFNSKKIFSLVAVLVCLSFGSGNSATLEVNGRVGPLAVDASGNVYAAV